MTREEMIAKLYQNKPACWIAWEIQNLGRTFKDVLDEYSITTERDEKHTMYDTLENLTGSLMMILDIPIEGQASAMDEIWEMFESLEFRLIYTKNGKEFSIM